MASKGVSSETQRRPIYIRRLLQQFQVRPFLRTQQIYISYDSYEKLTLFPGAVKLNKIYNLTSARLL
jgi:hypothetical protein